MGLINESVILEPVNVVLLCVLGALLDNYLANESKGTLGGAPDQIIQDNEV